MVTTHSMLRVDGRSRGQVLVLACVTMLLVALMMMLSFNLTQVIHEKIRIQSHSDAAAYSVAVMEARGLNTIAYANRAIAAAMVAQSALHSWMALCSIQVSLHQEFSKAFREIADREYQLCRVCCPRCCMEHCRDAATARAIAANHSAKANEVGQKVKGLEGQFNQGVQALKQMVTDIKKGEEDVVRKVIDSGRSGSDLLSKLQQINAPNSSYIDAVFDKNAGEFTCALEGSDSSSCGKGDISLHSKLMQNSSNAARPSFERNTSHTDGNIYPDFIPMSGYLMNIQQNEGSHDFSYESTSRVSDDSSKRANLDNELRNAMGFADNGSLFVQWRHATGGGSPNAKVRSDTQGGAHSPGAAHQAEHDRMKDCSQEECYISFRSIDSKARDWGQPTTYAAVQQDLRTITCTTEGAGPCSWNGRKGPWEVNANATVQMKIINGQVAKVRLVPEGTGVAVSKAKVYYHQLGDNNWKHAPNLFDPFWRAKLHPFSRGELSQILQLAGDTNGEQSISAGAPVEGLK